jgi:hypothetical protein
MERTDAESRAAPTFMLDLSRIHHGLAGYSFKSPYGLLLLREHNIGTRLLHLPPERQPDTCLVIVETTQEADQTDSKLLHQNIILATGLVEFWVRRDCSSWYVTVTCHTISLSMLISSELAKRCSPGKTSPC